MSSLLNRFAQGSLAALAKHAWTLECHLNCSRTSCGCAFQADRKLDGSKIKAATFVKRSSKDMILHDPAMTTGDCKKDMLR